MKSVKPPPNRYLLCATLVWLAGAYSAHASIVIPDRPQFTLESDSDRSAAAPDTETSNPSTSKDLRMIDFGPTSTGTSTNPVNIGAGSISVFALRSVAPILISDQTLSGWLTDEHRLAVPIPPVNSLLRPPQEWQGMSA